MFGSVLVTPTLLDSFEFAANAPYDWKASSMKDFIGKIKREKIDYPAWVGKGMDFEDTVYRVCKTSTAQEIKTQGSDNFRKVTAACYGGTFQNKLKKNLKIGEHKAFFFGYTDVDFINTTKDIKTCLKWKTKSKYLNKNQHKMYLWMNEKTHFEYIVAEWENQTSDIVKSVHIIPYTNPGSDVLEKDIVERTKALFEFIHSKNLWEDYYYTFSKN